MNADFWSSTLVCVVLVASAAWLMRAHHHTWRQISKRKESDPRQWEYRRNQYRRRMQTSGMLGVVGIAVFAGYFLGATLPGLFEVLYWLGVLVLVGWLVVLAMADVVSTRMYFGRLRRDHALEQKKLEAEIKHTARVEGNGAPAKPDRG